MDTLQWLDRLIRFNSISKTSNLELIESIDNWFKLHHIYSKIIPGPTESRVNLFATIPARNNQKEGGILLSGHTDVVPVGGQIWNTDPFVATESDNKIYGRGACDMKGFLAVILALVPEFKKLNLLKPIHFSFTCDEEIGCIGVNYVIDFLKKHDIRPEGCIVGEPSNMRPIIGGKSRKLYHCQVQGKAAHSSLAFEGCNAIEYGSRLISYINSIARYVKENGPFDNDYDCPFSTITVNIVSGGNATNVIPGVCEFILEVRYINQFLIENFRSQIENYIHNELLPEMRKTYSEAMIYFDETSDASGFRALEDSSITRIVRAVTGIQERLKVSYGTEAGIIQNAHIPTVICGPGDIKQAHNPNEFITIEQLNLCEKVLKNVITFFCVAPQGSEM
ncbi:acetylornithine deacetylase [Legionella parisiensis]|uniref:Acetylornithine deacetylase n=1 Tax=Legionella parisiensis TaxID=45071 RepID=A0A1E5JTV8_9GAMM|nr:acetylornithine deacetylase [Legionella parisiensis]KTD43104.1 acetylornithine deacetylase [Legionella parisiensis]OEH47984.1 Acetylornithine deacetylase [Legionella parisiensis]STX77817.1 Acetylornithine deacetylase [Legionella parisiensis]